MSYVSQVPPYRIENYAFSKLCVLYKRLTGNSFDTKDLPNRFSADFYVETFIAQKQRVPILQGIFHTRRQLLTVQVGMVGRVAIHHITSTIMVEQICVMASHCGVIGHNIICRTGVAANV